MYIHVYTWQQTMNHALLWKIQLLDYFVSLPWDNSLLATILCHVYSSHFMCLLVMSVATGRCSVYAALCMLYLAQWFGLAVCAPLHVISLANLPFRTIPLLSTLAFHTVLALEHVPMYMPMFIDFYIIFLSL